MSKGHLVTALIALVAVAAAVRFEPTRKLVLGA